MEGEQNDATTDGELVPAMSSIEKKLFIFAFVILVALIAGASVFYSLENQTNKPVVEEPAQPTVAPAPEKPAPQAEPVQSAEPAD